MTIIDKFIQKQLTDFTNKEGMYVLNKDQRDMIMCSAISLEVGTQKLQMYINSIRDAIEHGKDPNDRLDSMEFDLKYLEREAKWIEEIMK